MARLWRGGVLVRVAVVALVAGLVLALGWYLARPLLFNQRVDEAFPAAAPVAGVASGAMAPPTVVASGAMAPPTVVAGGAMAPPTVVAGGAMAHPTVVAGGAMAHPTAMVAPATLAAPTPAGPVLLREGLFGNMDDNLHKGQGRAAIYNLGDGMRVLRLEDFSVTNGPDLYVYLSASPNPRTARDFGAAPSVNLAPLKGNIGNQNYSLPADLDLAAYQSVVIYCKKYDVIISTAALSPSKG